MHEVVTLQFGSQSNYIGTHFWNAQEAYFTYSEQEESPVDHNVHFRPGIGADGAETFTPRVVIYDFKPNFGSLRRINELYEVFGEQAAAGTVWGGTAVPHREAPVAPNTYQQQLAQGLEPLQLTPDTVRFWSDFNRVFYHPRSIVQVHDAGLMTANRAFSEWESGLELFDSMNRDYDVFEKDTRHFIEECDQLQAIQLYTTSDDGWSAFTHRYIQLLRDEIGKTPIVVFAADSHTSGTTTRINSQTAYKSRFIHEVWSDISLLVPIRRVTPPFNIGVDLDVSSLWHTSALQSMAIESSFLPTRLKGDQLPLSTSMNDMVDCLSGGNRQKISALRLSLSGSTAEYNFFHASSLATARRERTTFAEIKSDRVYPTANGNAEANNDADEIIDSQRTQRYSTSLLFPRPSSFPDIFPVGSQDHDGVELNVSLKVESDVREWLRVIENGARRVVSIEEREAIINSLREIGEAYEEGYQSGSSSGDD